MQKDIEIEFEKLIKIRREPLTELVAQALKIGLHQLFVDSVLKQYLGKKISRKKAIQWVGIDTVKLADAQRKAVEKDIAWGLGRG